MILHPSSNQNVPAEPQGDGVKAGEGEVLQTPEDANPPGEFRPRGLWQKWKS